MTAVNARRGVWTFGVVKTKICGRWQVLSLTPLRRLVALHHVKGLTQCECRYAVWSAILPRHSPSSAVAARNCLADSAAYPRSRPCGAG